MIKIEQYKAGNFVKQLDYKAFAPNFINAIFSWEDRRLTKLIEEAAITLGQLDAYADLVPNIDHFIKMYVVKEATVSSRIEGTQTNMEEALMAEMDVAPEQRNDWKEVNNYVLSMNNALESLPQLPLSSRLLRQAHFDLMQNVRGEHKMPGEFRSSQNWIGGNSLKNAAFIPPVWQDVNPLMSDLEKFIHNDDTGLTHLMKIALAHYQFETIHPFLDGNGRVGRLMISLYLIEKGILRKPVLYLSDFFEKNRTYYYDNLTRVRTHNDLLNWMIFFSTGVVETSRNAIASLKAILALKGDCEKRIFDLGKKAGKAKIMLDNLFQQPIVDGIWVSKTIEISQVAAYKYLDDFVRLGILREMTGYKRNRVYIFETYFEIFRN
jgi:Fic family protein